VKEGELIPGNIKMKYAEILPYIEKKLISEQVHPENPDVRIFNYTQHCQFEAAWDDITMQCRGLIMNVKTGEILAKPFPKFFNYGEYIDKKWPIPNERPRIAEKLDGSLGILYSLNGKPWIATRGSFTSDQAIWATKWWRENMGEAETTNKITNLFEIIYPENRIVINYDFSGLVYLTSLFTETGIDCTSDPRILFGAEIRTPIYYHYENIAELEKLDTPNSEGFVLFYPKANKRIKIKFPEYVRLHKLITGISEIAIWEHLREGNTLEDLLEKVPDEFFKWVESVQNKLNDQFQNIWVECDTVTAEAMLKSSERKEQALYIQANTKFPGVCFSMLDNKDYKQGIWRLIRPRGQSQFKIDIDA
jgi:hypothetical protein